MKISIANIKGDDHKTYGRMGKNLVLELSRWDGDISGTITTMPTFSNLVIEIYESNTGSDER